MVAMHPRCRRRDERRTVLDHLPPDAREFFRRDRSWCLEQARAVGPGECSFKIPATLESSQRDSAIYGARRSSKSSAPVYPASK
jgi:hypothetical protein